MTEDKQICSSCGAEMEPGVVRDSPDNPEPYPQGSMRKYTCPECGISFIKEGITESNKPPKEE